MKKNKKANFIMIALILLIAAAGILGVGVVQGWFDRSDGSQAVLTDIRGIVTMQRSGVSYPVEAQTVLRSGDRIICSTGATAVIRIGGGSLTLSNCADIQVSESAADHFSAQVTTGEIFADAPVTLTLGGQDVTLTDSVALVCADTPSVSVFHGSVLGAQSGQVIHWIDGKVDITKLELQSLNTFTIAQLRKTDRPVCFTQAQLDKLEADRWAQKQEQLTGPSAPTDPTLPAPTQPPTDAPTDAPTDPPTEPPTEPPTQPPTNPATQPPTNPPTNPPTQPPTEPPTEPPTTPPTQPEAPVYKGYCTISIRCDTILNNWDSLDPSKAGYVPENGVILPAVKVGFYDGETVFDVLKRVCQVYDIALEYSWTPLYDSYYVEGINHLYQFDCGEESGWMYKVNGSFSNYGCSAYTLTGEEDIVWCYSCVGFGEDVGGGVG